MGSSRECPVCCQRQLPKPLNPKSNEVVIKYDCFIVAELLWVGYENTRSVKAKINWIKANGYGGAFSWSIDLDDFNDLCGQGQYPLLTAMHSKLNGYRVPIHYPDKHARHEEGRLALKEEWRLLLVPPIKGHLPGSNECDQQVWPQTDNYSTGQCRN